MDILQKRSFDYLNHERKESRRSPTQTLMLNKILDFFDL